MPRSSRNRHASLAFYPARPLLCYQIVLVRSGSSLGYRRNPLGRAISLAHESAALLVRWIAKPTLRAAESLSPPLCRAESARIVASTRHLLRAVAVPLVLQ